MAATSKDSPLRSAREHAELSREAVARQLDPPVAMKTLERWETPGYRVKRFRLRQLALIYGVTVEQLQGRDLGNAA